MNADFQKTVTESVILTGGGLSLTFDARYEPLDTDWSRFNILLHERGGWVLQGTATAPTRAQFDAVLAGVPTLEIRADFRDLPSTTAYIDNVALTGAPSGGLLAAPAGDFTTLTRNENGSFTRVLKDGTVLDFDTEGKLVSETDRNDNIIVYDYNPDGSLLSVSDPGDPDRVISLAYANQRLDSVTDVAERVSQFVVDANGNLVVVVNPDDSTRRFASDQNGRLVAEASERGFVTTQNYGAAGRWTGSGFPDGASVSAQIAKDLGLADLGIGLGGKGNPLPYARPNETVELEDGNGNPFSMKFNEFSSPIEITDPIERTTKLERDENDQVTAIVRDNDGELPDGTVPLTVRSEIDYDARGNVTAQREAFGTPLQRQTSFEYEAVFNNVTKITDAGGFVTRFFYDERGNLEKSINPIGSDTEPTRVSDYDARGLETLRKDANGNETRFDYDALGNLEGILDAEGFETALTLDIAGRVTARTEGLVGGLPTPEARTTSFTYDALNRVETETDGEGNTTTARYDATGNMIENTDATGRVVTGAYDERDRLTLKDDPIQGPVSGIYDKNGNLETVTNALNNSVTLVYDPVNRLEKTTDPLLNDRLFTYDARDNLKTVTDGRQVLTGLVTTFAYDPLGRSTRRTNPLGESWTFSYDSLDNIKRTVDPKGQAIERVYDDLSRLTTVTLIKSDGTTVEDTIIFTYDANGNRLTTSDSDSALSFTHDALNRVLTAETLADPGTVQPPIVLTSTYDNVGNRTQLQATEGPVIAGIWTYGHDAVGRLISLVSPAGDPLNPVSLGYDAAGRLARIDFPNGVASQITYGLDGRLENIAYTNGLLDLASFGYTTRPDGLIETITEPGGIRRFTYDNFQQLTSGGFDGTTESYQYDEEGNRTLTHLSTGHNHDDANRLTEDDSFCYAYDANGNLETRTEKIASSCLGNPTTSYVWDVRNQLVRINFPDSTFASYRYDALKRRIEKNVNGAITRYLYDNDNIIMEYDGSNTRTARYSHGIAVDQPLVQERMGTTVFYHADRLGSVQRLTDVSGLAVNSYSYDAYGNLTIQIESVVNPYTFTARELDPESKFHYYRLRYYDPMIGRFLSEDPLDFAAGDLNLYRYVFDNPVNFNDPNGAVLVSDAITRCFAVGFGAAAGTFAAVLANRTINFAAATIEAVLRRTKRPPADIIMLEEPKDFAVTSVKVGIGSFATCAGSSRLKVVREVITNTELTKLFAVSVGIPFIFETLQQLLTDPPPPTP